MHPKDEEGIANSVDPDQTAPGGAVWSGSALFAQTCVSENRNITVVCNLGDIKWLSLTNNNCAAVGLSSGFFDRQESTKFLKSLDHSPPERAGESFWAIWYNALIAFMLNNGGFLSAEME